jgi:hypothetical protein
MGPTLYILSFLAMATFFLWMWFKSSTKNLELNQVIRTPAFNWFSMFHSFLYQFIDI